jgi:hypothetical protein
MTTQMEAMRIIAAIHTQVPSQFNDWRKREAKREIKKVFKMKDTSCSVAFIREHS